MIKTAAIVIWTLVAVLAVIYFTEFDDAFDTQATPPEDTDPAALEASKRAYEATGESHTPGKMG